MIEEDDDHIPLLEDILPINSSDSSKMNYCFIIPGGMKGRTQLPIGSRIGTMKC